ncbi:Hsp90 co-chaperone Cdc37 [Wickerhamiella sorbophila]|uniref:Hsp90 chaperone protein kinase-targeting subunit n=1 Tax=Wickerhamiella sorbophila TaxID=45607 RepID=A0A2T0FHA8_9ASCO|nr:Hsp90 co-chaperone Cdc37 [Wickerhamiella sorbophila]PRT54347.1 Hsp90 co-chaperone Cdc37 [Wickerhamiella sorbophila]
MPIDYSKWDKLELSDDSDVEVHPNVDKKSFIRWKQRDIHEKRERNRLRTQQLELNVETNEDLIKRVRKLIAAAESGVNVGADVEASVKLASEGETKERPDRATSAQQPKYNDMVESLLIQITQEAKDREGLIAQLKHHEKMISDSIEAENKELEELQEERAKHIVSEDLHDGWNSTIVYKSDKKDEEPAKPSPSKETTTEIEVLNPSSSSKPAPRTPKKNEDGLEELLPNTKEFGKVTRGDLSAAYRFMGMHPEILSEGQKDALMMSAFDAQLAGDSDRAETIVFNALLIQYVVLLGGNAQAFFSKVVQPNHPARTAFDEDVNRTFEHIKHRCEILSQENAADEGEEQEQIQLHAVDPNTEIVVAVPEEGSEGRAIYDALSEPVRKAIESRKLDEINKVLAELEVAEAEDLVGKLGEAGVLLVEEKIYDAAEWQEKQHELEEELD